MFITCLCLFLKCLSSPDCGIKCRTHQVTTIYRQVLFREWRTLLQSNSFLSPVVTLPAYGRSRVSTSWFFFLNFCFGESWYSVIRIVIVCFSFAVFILWFVWLCHIRRCLFFLCRPTFLGWSSAAHRKRASCCWRTPLHDKWPFWPFCIVLLLINTDESTIFVVHNNKNMIEWKYDD